MREVVAAVGERGRQDEQGSPIRRAMPFEGHRSEIEELPVFAKAGIVEHSGPEPAGSRPDQSGPVQVRPLPIRLCQADVCLRVDQFMFIPVTTFTGMAADLSMGIFSQQPAVAERFLEDVVLVGDSGRQMLSKSPSVSEEAGVVNTETFAAPAAARPVAVVAEQPGFTTRLPLVSMSVQPISAVAEKESAALPTVTFGIEVQSLQVRCLGNRGPGPLRKPLPIPVHGEVKKVRSVRREIAPSLIDTAAEPLAEGEGIGLSVPEHRADLPGRPPADDEPDRCFPGQEYMKSCGERWHAEGSVASDRREARQARGACMRTDTEDVPTENHVFPSWPLAVGRTSMRVGPPATQEVTMPVYFLLGLTVLILVIAVYATVVEEVEEVAESLVDSTLDQDWEALTYDQRQEYRKAG